MSDTLTAAPESGDRTRPWAALTVLNLGLFITLLDATIVNVALPRLTDTLHASLDEAAWVTNAYTLALAVLLLAAARLGDIYGPRMLFMVGTAVFTAASLACGLATGTVMLIVARAVQGIGAALLVPQPLAIVRGLFPPERRGSAFAVNGIVAGLATLAGPLLGGFLVTSLGWRSVFYVNVPIGVVSIAATLWLVPDFRSGRAHRLDIAGVLLASTGLTALTYALIEGQRYAWGTIWSFLSVPVVLTFGLAALAVFGWQQSRGQQGDPLVPFGVFRSRDFTLMSVVGAALQLAFSGFLFPFTLYLQSVLGLSAMRAGLVTAPMAIANIAVSPLLGRIVDRRGARGVLTAGIIAFAAGILLVISAVTVGQDPAAFILGMIVMGFGSGATFSPMIAKAMSASEPQHAGAASGLLNTSRQLGGVLGGAAITAVLESQLSTALYRQALGRTAALPAPLRAEVLAAFRKAARAGLEVGAGQTGIRLPPGIGAATATELRLVYAQAFQHAYVDAARPALLVCVGALAIGAVCAFASRGGPTADVSPVRDAVPNPVSHVPDAPDSAPSPSDGLTHHHVLHVLLRPTGAADPIAGTSRAVRC
jgi:EmrB/QacA subfamily drug resistance transporter